MLKREEILAAADVKSIDVEVPEWGGTVRVREMSGTQRDLYEQELVARQDKDKVMHNVRALLVTYTAVDETGAALFTPADVEELGKKSSTALDRVFQAACKLNGIGQPALEVVAKN